MAQYLTTKTEQPKIEQTNKVHKKKRQKKQQEKQSTAIDVAVEISRVLWRFYCHDRLKVVLLLLPPAGKSGKHKFRLQLNFEMESIDWIPRLRLVPNRNNLGTTNQSSTVKSDSGNAESILYNHCLTEDALHLFSPRSHDESTLLPPNCFGALKLLQIWCLQRGFLRGHDTLQSVQLQATVAYLYRTHRIHGRTAPLQVVTACWKWWSESVMDSNDNKTKKSVWVVPLPNLTESQTIAQSSLAQMYQQQTRESPLTDHDPSTLVELYQQELNGRPVLLDSSLTHNYFGRWSPAFARALQRQSKKSLDGVTQPQSPTFHHLFLTRARFWDCHDAYLRIPIGNLIQKQSSPNETNDSYESWTSRLLDTLYRALGDRVRLLQFHTTGNGIPGHSSDSAAVTGDSDEIPTFSANAPLPVEFLRSSPTGSDALVLGVTINPDTCFRVVDRGPPNEKAVELRAFLQLWGHKAELRRFQDGAIVHAVVWDKNNNNTDDGLAKNQYTVFENDDTWQGGLVEHIIRHILRLHFLKPKADTPQFALRNLVSTVDGVVQSLTSSESSSTNKAARLLINPLTAHRTVMKAAESLTDFLRQKSALTVPVPGSTTELRSALGLPLAIDAVEPLSPALRYAALYPPVPHPLLGAESLSIPPGKSISGAVSFEPVEIQIRFGASSKWPSDLKAIGAAKTAMLIALVDGIEALLEKNDFHDGPLKYFDGPRIVTPSHADICYLGYVFRITVRADPELQMLRRLRQPSLKAESLRRTLERTTVLSPRHHMLVHAVYTRHPSASATVRLVQRWVATHLLSDHLPFEALEWMIVHVYTDSSSPLDPPGTAVAGFMRFLQLFARHDWQREPMIADPSSLLTTRDRLAIREQFERTRGSSFQNGAAMYIVSPCTHALLDDEQTKESDGASSATAATGLPARNSKTGCLWTPIHTLRNPERVVLSRAIALADRTHSFLQNAMMAFENSTWPAVFQESAESFRSYSALLRVDSALAFNKAASSTPVDDRSVVIEQRASDDERLCAHSSYTRSMQSLFEGPKELRRKLYRNLRTEDDGANGNSVLLEWNPVQATILALRRKLGNRALFFYNHLCPDVIGVVWRPFGSPQAFSALVSEYMQPAQADDWRSDTMVTINVCDLLREMGRLTVDIVTNVKVLDAGPFIQPSVMVGKRMRAIEHEDDDESACSSATSSSESDSE